MRKGQRALQIAESAATTFPLAYSIAYLFALAKQSERRSILRDTHPELKQTLAIALVNLAEQNDTLGALERAVNDGSDWLFSYIVNFFNAGKPKAEWMLPLEEWQRFADVLLAYADRKPYRGVPLIAPLVVAHKRRFGGPLALDKRSAEFIPDQAQQRFDWSRLKPILANFDVAVVSDPDLAFLCEKAVEAARQELAANAEDVEADPSSALPGGGDKRRTLPRR